MSLRTLTLRATNAAGYVEASAAVTVADPPGAGNTIELVGTNLFSDVDPNPTRTAVYAGNMGQAGVFADSGMTYCPWYGPAGALAVTGGGHADYGGNEVYVFDLNVNTWKRINAPSVALQAYVVGGPLDPIGADLVHGEFADGSPCASHTYSSLTAIPGGNKGMLLGFSKTAIPWAGGTNCAWSHAWDLETGEAVRFSVNAPPIRYDGQAAEVACYDESRNRVWGFIRGGGSKLSYLDLATRAHSGVLATLTNGGYIPTCARTPVHDLLLHCFADYTNPPAAAPFQLAAIDLANPAAGQRFLTLAGDLPGPTTWCAYGFDWDGPHDCGYVYRGNWTAGTEYGQDDNAHVWRVDRPSSGPLLTGVWTLTKIALPAPLPRQLNGVYSRWRYCSGIGKFALVSNRPNRVALWTPPA